MGNGGKSRLVFAFSGCVFPRLKTSSGAASVMAATTPSTMSETYVKSRCSSSPSSFLGERQIAVRHSSTGWEVETEVSARAPLCTRHHVRPNPSLLYDLSSRSQRRCYHSANVAEEASSAGVARASHIPRPQTLVCPTPRPPMMRQPVRHILHLVISRLNSVMRFPNTTELVNPKYAMSGRPTGPYTVKKRRPWDGCCMAREL